MVSYFWIRVCFDFLDTVNQIVLEDSMRSYRITLTCGDEPLGEIDMKRRIFRGDSLWPFMCVKCFIQLTHLPTAESSYKFARIWGAGTNTYCS